MHDKCPHKGGPLSQGIVHGETVTCPLHGFKIGLKDGEAVRVVFTGKQAKLKQQLDDGSWMDASADRIDEVDCARQAEVSDQHVQMRLARQDLERLLAVFGLQHTVPLPRQVICQHHQDNRFVLDDEYYILCIYAHGKPLFGQ